MANAEALRGRQDQTKYMQGTSLMETLLLGVGYTYCAQQEVSQSSYSVMCLEGNDSVRQPTLGKCVCCGEVCGHGIEHLLEWPLGKC